MAEDKAMNGTGITDAGFPMWPQLHRRRQTMWQKLFVLEK